MNYLVLLFEKWSNQFFLCYLSNWHAKWAPLFDVTTEGITTLIIVTRLSGKNTENRRRLFRQQQELKWRHSHLLQWKVLHRITQAKSSSALLPKNSCAASNDVGDRRPPSSVRPLAASHSERTKAAACRNMAKKGKLNEMAQTYFIFKLYEFLELSG